MHKRPIPSENPRAEAIPNRHLPFRRRRSAAQLGLLRELGWCRPRPGVRGGGYTRSWSVSGAAGCAAVAAELERVLEEVYGFGPDDDLRMELAFDG